MADLHAAQQLYQAALGDTLSAGTQSPAARPNPVGLQPDAYRAYMTGQALLNDQNIDVPLTADFRTGLQQADLIRRYKAGEPGIYRPAPVGTSNHEKGRAIDIDIPNMAPEDASRTISVLGGQGWRYAGAKDPVHFDYVGTQSQSPQPSAGRPDPFALAPAPTSGGRPDPFAIRPDPFALATGHDPFALQGPAGHVLTPEEAVGGLLGTGMEPYATGPVPSPSDHPAGPTTTEVLGHAVHHPGELPGALWNALGQLWGGGGAAMEQFAHEAATQGPRSLITPSNLADIAHAGVSAFQDYGHPGTPNAISEALGIRPDDPGWLQTAAKALDYGADLVGNPANLIFGPATDAAVLGAAKVGAKVGAIPVPLFSKLPAPLASYLGRDPTVGEIASEIFSPITDRVGAVKQGIADSALGQAVQRAFPGATAAGTDARRALGTFHAGVDTDASQAGNVVRGMADWTAQTAKENPAFAQTVGQFVKAPPAGAAGPGPLQDVVMRAVVAGRDPAMLPQIAAQAARYGIPMEAVTGFADRLESHLHNLFDGLATGDVNPAWWRMPEVRQAFIEKLAAPGLFAKAPAKTLGEVGSQAFAANGARAVLEPHWQMLLSDLNDARQAALDRLGGQPSPKWQVIPQEAIYGALRGLSVPPEVYRAATQTQTVIKRLVDAATAMGKQGAGAAVQSKPQSLTGLLTQYGPTLKKLEALPLNPFNPKGMLRTRAGMAQRVGQAGLGLAAEGGNPLAMVKNVSVAQREIAAALKPGGPITPQLEEFMRNSPGFWHTEFNTLGLAKGKTAGELAASVPADLKQKLGEIVPNMRTGQDRAMAYGLYKTLLPGVREEIVAEGAVAPAKVAAQAAKETAGIVERYMFDFSRRRLEGFDRIGGEEFADVLRLAHLLPGASTALRLAGPNSTKAGELLVGTALRKWRGVLRAAAIASDYSKQGEKQ